MAIFILPVFIWSMVWHFAGRKVEYCQQSPKHAEECRRELDERRQFEASHPEVPLIGVPR